LIFSAWLGVRLHFISFHFISFHFISFHFISFHCIALFAPLALALTLILLLTHCVFWTERDLSANSIAQLKRNRYAAKRRDIKGSDKEERKERAKNQPFKGEEEENDDAG